MIDLVFNTSFTLTEWLALTGFAQCLLIVTYILFRMQSFKQSLIPLLYFAVLGCAFALKFALRLSYWSHNIEVFSWFFWAMGPPLCYLLVLQIARQMEPHGWKDFWVLLLVPFAFAITWLMRGTEHVCGDSAVVFCDRFLEWLYWLGAMAGALTMLALWARHKVLTRARAVRGGRERYWLIVTLVAVNVMVLVISFLRSINHIGETESQSLLLVFGITFVYLATTSLFRVYPPPVQLNRPVAKAPEVPLSADEKLIVKQIEKLLVMDKVYHEAAYGRTQLAQELKIPESNLSRVINMAFGKSLPQLLNEYRVEDAKRLLCDPDIPVQVVAFEVGFNSLASFNRVFKDMTGQSPSLWRNENTSEG